MAVMFVVRRSLIAFALVLLTFVAGDTLRAQADVAALLEGIRPAIAPLGTTSDVILDIRSVAS